MNESPANPDEHDPHDPTPYSKDDLDEATASTARTIEAAAKVTRRIAQETADTLKRETMEAASAIEEKLNRRLQAERDAIVTQIEHHDRSLDRLEGALAQPFARDRLEPMRGDDDVGVDILAAERIGLALDLGELFHQSAAFGNAGSLATSAGSCWMIAIA